MLSGLWIKTQDGKAKRHPWTVFLPLLFSILALAGGLYFGIPQGNSQPGFKEKTRADVLSLLQAKDPPSQTQVDELWLFLEEGKLDTQLTRLKAGEKPDDFIKGLFRWGDDAFSECGVRLRGSMAWHHTAAKPSLRVKFPRKQNRYGYRYLELHRSEDPWGFINRAPEWIALQEQLMSGYTFPARLFLNRKDLGLYMAALRPGAELAIANSRIPGCWFKGDVMGGSDSLWLGLKAWRIFGASEAVEAESRFTDFLALFPQAPTFTMEQRARFSELVNEDRFALWDALGVLTGQVHTDDHHNQIFFFSSYFGEIEPVVWDSNAFGPLQLADGGVNVLNNRVKHLALTDPRYVHKRNVHLYRLLNDYYVSGRLRKWMDEEVARLKPVSESETALGIIASRYPLDGPRAAEGDIFHRPLSVADLDGVLKDLYDWVDQRQAFLENYLSGAKVAIESTPQGTLVTVYGDVAIEVSLPNGSSTLLYPGLAYRQEKEVGRRITRAAPFTYALPIAAENLSFKNAVTGAEVEPGEKPSAEASENTFSFHPWSFNPKAKTEEVRLGPGEVLISEDMMVDKGTKLIVEAGTELRLEPGVSVYCAGVVEALGTEDKPIRIRPAGAEPFGCIGLAGASTAGSAFRYVDCEGGSVGAWRGVNFKGMFNVYGCPDLKLSFCRFANNKVGDDTVNLGAGHAVVSNCLFEDGKADGLDLDQMTGRVVDTRFLRAGNDGLDLMTCQITVENCLMERCGDKGISVGEGSKIEVSNCRFIGNEKGIEGKDNCLGRIADSTFQKNGLAVNLYRKKWLFPSGGRLVLSNCELLGNKQDVSVDAESMLWLDETEAREPYGSGVVHHRGPAGFKSLGGEPVE